MLNLTNRRFYWACQLGGWLLYIALNAFVFYIGDSLNGNVAFGLTFIFILGIALTQALRWVIIRMQWLRLPIPAALVRVLFVNILMGTTITLLLGGLDRLETGQMKFDLVRNISSYTFVFFTWSVIYFLVHFIENYKKAEIENLRWAAVIHETELNKLKSQLNPHFMFNAMNSIRALVGENPQRAKEAVTQLANLLRNTLQMGRHKLIPFGQELDIVRDYLAIESVRLEERLDVAWKIAPGCESIEVPPMMIQTLVENGIKHGIARLPEGGKLSVQAARQNGGLSITIRNSGQYDETKLPESGFGMRNTKERLELLYAGRAAFSIANESPDTVITQLFIPPQLINGDKNAES
jgi:two-component system, LytTR family, sensor kinase